MPTDDLQSFEWNGRMVALVEMWLDPDTYMPSVTRRMSVQYVAEYHAWMDQRRTAAEARRVERERCTCGMPVFGGDAPETDGDVVTCSTCNLPIREPVAS